MDKHFREPIFIISTEGTLSAGTRAMDEDDASKEFGCQTTCPDWMIRRAYAALLAKDIEND